MPDAYWLVPARKMCIAKEGYRFVVTAALVALLALALGWGWIALICAFFALGFLGFFRDPERAPPSGTGLVLSPADGKIMGVGRGDKAGLFKGMETRISIFMSPLDVHVNRAPVAGRVEDIRYQKGRFLAAYKEEASQDNERNAVTIVDAEGRRLGVVQIAGVLARRIICRVNKGDALEQGQRLGLIMFGSRVDLFLPGQTRVEVVEGQRVRAGETIMGRLQ